MKRLVKLSIFLAISCQLSVISCFAQPKYIRVAIMQGAPSLRLKIKGFYEIVNPKNNTIFYRGKDLNTTVTTYKHGFLFGNVKSNNNKVLIRPDDPQALILEGRKFRGNIELIRQEGGEILAINDIEVEDYVKGILYHEASHYWPKEALKAQAVVSRTYAIYQMEENRHKDFDVTSDIYSQVYGGKTSERFRTNKAVEDTEGIILVYKNKTFPTYFHATCGGHTEDASLLWNIDIPPLKGVVCAYCKESPHFNWHAVLSLQELEEKLRGANFKVKGIEKIEILGKDPSGRITELKIKSAGRELKIAAKDFRIIIGPNIIMSTNFSLWIAGKDAVFEGIGWGHGVGLCQWGAYFMAKEGKDFKEILRYYYPQADVKTL